MTKQVIQAVPNKSVDQELGEHLKKAEEHLIEAVKLFTKTKRPDRSGEYLKRLERAQQTVTTLFREELVRMRGPIRLSRKRR